ncbi:MAG: ABC transporter permease subunit [Sporichthyaceae bacterium]
MEFHLLGTVLVAGLVNAGLYGFLPISIILSYRISRTIAFVHGGIAAAAALLYWLLAAKAEFLPDFIIQYDDKRYGSRPELNETLSLAIVLAFGAAVGAAYGAIVMSRRIATLSVLTLTVISLGSMMGLIGIFQRTAVQPDFIPGSPFGSGGVQIGDVFLTQHKIVTFFLVLALCPILALLLTRTHTGLIIRALADDQEAGVWCGVKLREIGTLVYAGSGALAALAGVAIAVIAGPNPADMLLLFLRGLAIAAVGGMVSLPLALFAALLFAFMETALIVGFFGEVSLPMIELVLSGSLLTVIVVVARFRRDSFFLLERQSL